MIKAMFLFYFSHLAKKPTCNKGKTEENQKKPKFNKALSAGRVQHARSRGAKCTTRTERDVALSVRLCAQRDYEKPKPKFAPINKRVSLGKRAHFLRAQFLDFWHSVLSFSLPFLILLLFTFFLSPLFSL